MKKTAIILFFLIFGFYTFSQNVVIVIIDGARYTETFGDDSREFIPKMSQLATQGTYIDEFYNDGLTYTSRAIPALWCGTWTEVEDIYYNGQSTQYTLSPSIFEYFEKQKNPGENQNIYSLKYIESLWLQSFHDDYGEEYWPTVFSSGDSDLDVFDNTIQIMNDYHPQFLWVYLADVDHEGHSGNWNNYTGAIEIADSIVDEIWKEIQNNPYYTDNTTLLVTNDHGRHTNDFSGHGCDCDGCRHIMFLALGPNIKQNYVSNQYRIIPDFAVTAASVLDVEMEYADGEVLTEIFANSSLLEKEEIDFKANSKYAEFYLKENTFVTLEIFDLTGRKIQNIISENRVAGKNIVEINSNNLNGIYLIKFTTNNFSISKKVVFL